MTKIIDLEEKRQEFQLRRATVDMMDAFKRVAERVKQQLEEEEASEEEPADDHEGDAAEESEDP